MLFIMKEKQITSQAKKIMDDFSKALNSVKLEASFNLIREKSFREEGSGEDLDEDFKQRFLANASKTKGDAIVASKGSWI